MSVQSLKAIVLTLAFLSLNAFASANSLSSRMYIPKRCPKVNRVIESGIRVECKTCPYTLCTNKIVYPSNLRITVNGWAAGSTIKCEE
jgi:hypothetical protein